MSRRVIDAVDPDARKVRTESFLNGAYAVRSRSGLSRAEAALVGALAETPRAPTRVLILGNRTGVVGIIAADLYPRAHVEVHCLDIHHARAVEANFARNAGGRVDLRCQAYLEHEEWADLALVQSSRGGMSRELLLDRLQECHLALREGGKLVLSIEGAAAWPAAQVRRLFGDCSVSAFSRGVSLLTARKRGPLKKIRDRSAEFEMPLPDGPVARLMTVPGVFAHRRVDEGAQALAEAADVQDGDTVLDLGCGCGAIGIALALRCRVAEVCFVDSDARAIHVTEANCRRNGLRNWRTVLSDEGPGEDDRFSLFVGNPPYYSHHSISARFIDVAHHRLTPGGRAWIVARNAQWHFDYMKDRFGNAERLARRGYELVRSVR